MSLWFHQDKPCAVLPKNEMPHEAFERVNSTPLITQYIILSNKWGAVQINGGWSVQSWPFYCRTQARSRGRPISRYRSVLDCIKV